MQLSSMTRNLESEFIPPLDFPETWGMSWDKQVAANLAWQEAGGNAAMHTQGRAGEKLLSFPDRRTRSVVIDFPDRRKAA